MKKNLLFCFFSIGFMMLMHAQKLQYSTWPRFDCYFSDATIDLSVVFISSFNNRSIQASRHSGLTFLQKPFNLIDLRNAVNEASQPVLKDFRQQLGALEHELELEK